MSNIHGDQFDVLRRKEKLSKEENGCGKAALVTLLRHFRRLSVVTALSCLCLSLSSVYSFPKSEYVTENGNVIYFMGQKYH